MSVPNTDDTAPAEGVTAAPHLAHEWSCLSDTEKVDLLRWAHAQPVPPEPARPRLIACPACRARGTVKEDWVEGKLMFWDVCPTCHGKPDDAGTGLL